MPHTYDSGLAVAQRTLLRRRVVAALQPLTFGQGAYLRAVVELVAPVSFEADAAEQYFLDVVRGRTPCAAVALGGRDFNDTDLDGLRCDGPIDIHVYLVTAHARSQLARVEGDVASAADVTADPGLETTAEHVMQRIVGVKLLDTDGNPIVRPHREAFAYFDADLLVFEQVYRMELQTEINPRRALTEVIEEVEAHHALDAAPDTTIVETLTEVPP